DLAAAYNLIGTIALELNRTGEAEAAFRKVIALLDGNTGEGSEAAASLKTQQALAHNNLGKMHVEMTGRLGQAASSYQKALALWYQLVREDSNNPDPKRLQAVTLRNLYSAYSKMGRQGKAREALDQALHIQEKLRRRHPADLQYQLDLALTYDALAIASTD